MYLLVLRQPAQLSLKYVGKETDKVGSGGDPNPDGRPDGHFVFTVKTDSPKTIASLMLRSADFSGTPVGGQVWDTEPGTRFWILGVEREGKRLNPTDTSVRETVVGEATYHLYGNDSGWFNKGQSFRVDVRFADGTEAVVWTMVE